MTRRSADNAEAMGYDRREELQADLQDPHAPTPIECRSLAMLISCDAPSPSAVPKSWAPAARRLLSAGFLKITGAERVYRTTEAGRIERDRLRARGVQPATARPHRYAHDGEETTVSRGRS